MRENEFLHLITNDHLKLKIARKEDIVIVDVRQQEEYDNYHIPSAKLIPLGELSSRYTELNQDDDIYVICESGGRSDLAMNFLISKGFNKVANVLPGMRQWKE